MGTQLTEDEAKSKISRKYICCIIFGIIWFGVTGFMVYGCIYSWTVFDNIRKIWEPYADDDELMNEICDDKWEDKFITCKKDSENDTTCRPFTPYNRATSMYGLEISLFVFVILSIPISILVLYIFIKNGQPDGGDDFGMIPYGAMGLSILARLICSFVYVVSIPGFINDFNNYEKYCDDTTFDDINIYQELSQQRDKLDNANIYNIVEMVAMSVVLCMCIGCCSSNKFNSMFCT